MFHDLYADIQSSTLENGLSVYTKVWPYASWCYAGVVVHAGTREDLVGRAGLAHLVEHLLSENVGDLTFAQLEKQFRQLGGDVWLGETSYLASEYKFHLPNEEQSIQRAFDLFGQMLVLPRQLTKQIEEEKDVILREYHRKYEHEQSRSWALQGRPWLFEHHPRLNAYHCALGIPDEFLQSTQKDIQNYYDMYYVPHNMSLFCIGSLPHQKVLNLLRHSPFAQPRSGQRNSMPAPFFPFCPRKHEQIIHLSQFSIFTQQEATISYEWVLPCSFARRCVYLLRDLLADRLLEALRCQWQLTYSVDVGSTYYQDCRMFRITFQTAPASVEKARDIFWQVLQSIGGEEEEFDQVKQDAVWSFYRMDYSGYDFLKCVMDDLVLYQHLISFSEEMRQIEQTTFEQVVELARYLTEERHFCFVTLP